ncbi:Coenzyme Q-binding protein coq10, mitochondrial [Lachnellula hyalina]|uniref:Coenzyme Q-binding protein coq10, mitochondrial n=1 Tax=Lachnellula hyalina TaxID=1316788 RepID=A0A8H8U0Z1_9HELO|nr:Coenzyme Q-binding protein coq10, mitochondrial [Lachnellula hyalina]TVY27835.1 Coenzyme Q-binding protein coq10, mitochondrial [Lachnellula hyalina]
MSKVLRTLRPQPILHSLRQPSASQSFLTLPGTEAQTLTATRILPYNSKSLYTLIADIDSYSSFLPYCLSSRVTKWSAPDKDGKRWPSEADLKVGWGGYEETFTSRLFCVPGSIVEALGGEAITSLPRADLEHHKETLDSPAIANGIFQSINTQWSVKPFHYKPPTGRPQTDTTEEPARDRTEVHLSLEFQFSNPLYAALSKAVAPKVAGIMIEAFEVRARKLLDGTGATVHRDRMESRM